jgi:homocysteine S-methyltransferase
MRINFVDCLDRRKPLILDGGLGSELDRRGQDISSKLWSAELLINNPQAITEVHRAYLDAGAQCITSASYQASIAGFASIGVSAQHARDLFHFSIEIARRECDEFLSHNPACSYQPMVAASVGPYGAFLADGSEYTGKYGVEDRTLVEFHYQRLEWLDQSGADVLACETIPSLQEASVLCELLKTVNTPAWISFSCRNGHLLNDGSSIAEAAALFERHPKVVALGVNCSAPQTITSLIGRIKSILPGKAIVVYPNSGEHYDAATKTWHGVETPLECAAAARIWFNTGASIIGGCCRMGPAHIAAIATEMNDQRDSTDTR